MSTNEIIKPLTPIELPLQTNRTNRWVLTVAARLYMAFGLLLILQFLLTAGGFFSLRGIFRTQADAIDSGNESLAYQKIQIMILKGLDAETGYVGMAEEEALQEMADAEKGWNEAFAELEAFDLSKEEQANIAQLKQLLSQTSNIFQQSITLVQAGDLKGAQENHSQKLDPVISEITILLDETIVPDELAETRTIEQISSQKISNSCTWILILGAAAMILGLVSSIGFSRSISNPIRQLTWLADEVASGNLEVQVNISSKTDIGSLARVFNRMVSNLRVMVQNEQTQREYLETTIARYMNGMTQVAKGNLSAQIAVDNAARAFENNQPDPLVALGNHLNEVIASLQGMIRQVQGVVEHLNLSSTEILSATAQQAACASEQSASISQTTTTVEEVKAIAEQNALRAQEVTDTAMETAEVSRQGLGAVRETITCMERIKEQVGRIAENILELSEKTQQIGEIVTAINNIAAQSNMLALNASVEAARAGEHGKGFAVVAAEVRSLAEQSKQATMQVKVILSDIQKATNAAVMATEEGIKGVEAGSGTAGRTGEAIEQLSATVDAATQSALQMAAGSRQQVGGVEQIVVAMQHINQTTIQSLVSTRQTERTVRDLNDLAENLSQIIQRYMV